MKKYEGLFILNLSGKEDGAKDALDKISNEITTPAARSRRCRKWIARRLPASRTSATAPASMPTSFSPARPTIVAQLQKKFSLNEEIFRVLFTLLPEPKPAKA